MMKLLITSAIASIFCLLPSPTVAFVPVTNNRATILGSSSSSALSRSMTTSPYSRTDEAVNNASQLQMASFPTLDDWAINSKGGITGIVISSDIPALPNGEIVATSKLVTPKNQILDGSVVETASGSRYKLGSKKGKKPRPPPAKAIYTVPTLNNWELQNGCITGTVQGANNPNLTNGEEVTTSKLVTQNGLKDGIFVNTLSGSKYKLGKRKKSTPNAATQVYTIPTLDNWELRDGCITGTVKGANNPNLTNGREVTTSKLVTQRGIKMGVLVTTLSGSKYKLGKENKAAKAPVSGTKPITTGSVSKSKPVVSQEPKPRKKRPAPFGSVGRGIKKGAGRDAPPPPEVVPTLDNWFVNRREQVCGNISNSPYANERDGKFLTTDEVATNMAFVEEGFTVLTMDGRKYTLGIPKGGRKMDYNDQMVGYITSTLSDWEVSRNKMITGVIKGSGNASTPDGTMFTTQPIMSDPQYIDEGFTVVSKDGMLYKLGPQKKVRKKEPFPTITKPKVRSSAVPILDDWSINRNNQVVGIVSNSGNRDGETLTTSELTTRNGLEEGVTVTTKSGSVYKLGRRQSGPVSSFFPWKK